MVLGVLSRCQSSFEYNYTVDARAHTHILTYLLAANVQRAAELGVIAILCLFPPLRKIIEANVSCLKE